MSVDNAMVKRWKINFFVEIHGTCSGESEIRPMTGNIVNIIRWLGCKQKSCLTLSKDNRVFLSVMLLLAALYFLLSTEDNLIFNPSLKLVLAVSYWKSSAVTF